MSLPFIQQNALQRIRVIHKGHEVFDKTIDFSEPGAYSKTMDEAKELVAKLSICRGCGEVHGYRYDQEVRRDVCNSCGTPA